MSVLNVSSGNLSAEDRANLQEYLQKHSHNGLDMFLGGNYNDLLRKWWSEYYQPKISKEYQNTYGLSDDDMKLLNPMLAFGSGYKEPDILNYIQGLEKSHQETDYAEGAIGRTLSAQRAAGYNPDLSGSAPSDSGTMSLPSASPFSISDLPSNGGQATLSAKFTDIAGMLLKTMSFGLQAYGVVSNNLLSTAGLLSGMADKDVLSLFGNDEGVVEDVDSAIASLVSSYGLHGRKAKQYASFVANRINSTGTVAARLRQSSDKALALYDKNINEFKASDEYTSQIISFLRDSSAMQATMAEFDLKIQQQKLDWLNEHPDYTAEQLDTELANLRSGKRKASADANKAVYEAGIAGEKLEQEKVKTQEVKDDYPVKKLASTIRQTELEGISQMIDFCKSYQRDMADVPEFMQKIDSTPRGIKYRNNMRYLEDWYYKNKNSDNKDVSDFVKLLSKLIK